MTEEADGYQSKITERAARDLDRPPEKVATACVEFIFGPLTANPLRLGKLLTGFLTGQHSARRGTYRVIYRIRDQTIEIVHINDRADSYKP
ncbi:MAG: type II toxin-antitoxin system RelE family toxin [Pseudonocardiaceae bacterium]